jgi:hypothetical protein
MREIRLSGSEGGGAASLPLSLPLSMIKEKRVLAPELLHLPDKPAGVWPDQGHGEKRNFKTR